MKTYIERFKKIIRFLVVLLSSREFAFVYCLMGVFAQVAHTYFLTSGISSFHGSFKVLQATLLSAFISSSLLYYVLIVDNTDSKENKQNKLAINILAFIEILINLYYYTRHLIINSPEVQIFDFIFAVLVSSFIPIMIKLYGGHIRAKEWFDEIMKEEIPSNEVHVKENIPEVNSEKIDLLINEKVDELNLQLTEYIDLNKVELLNINDKLIGKLIEEKQTELKNNALNNIDQEVTKIFDKNQKLFLNQFEAKVKLIMNQKLSQTSSNQ